MTVSWQLLASGPGWRVGDIVCRAGPGDRPFEERHADVCIAAVTEGSFQYRSSQGRAVLGPGSLLLGNQGHCFQCGHEHGIGDRCLAFHYAPEAWEEIVAAVPRARYSRFPVPRLPPTLALQPLLARAEAAREDGDAAELEELAVALAGAVAAELGGVREMDAQPSRRDERRVSEALRRIEAESDEKVSLAQLSRQAAMSAYHFLRSFRHVVGMAPYQYVLRTRLNRAAVRLRRSREPISAIAFGAGFNDLSTFNHRFRRIMGMSPSAYRQRKGRPARQSTQ